MKKTIYYLLLLAATTTFSCRTNPEIVTPNTKIEVNGSASTEGLSVAQDDTLKLRALVDNSTDFKVVWSVDGKEASKEVEFRFIAAELGSHSIELVVNNFDGGKSTAGVKVDVYGKYRHGAIILNEGNMSKENGSLIFINSKGVVTDSAYWRVNSTFLGNATQDLHIADDKIYIISQNGSKLGGDGMLVVANASTLQRVATYNDELSTLSWPTNIAVVGENAYIRDNKGLHLFDMRAKTLTLIEGSAGAAGNRMAVVGEKVFVGANDKIFVVKGNQIIHTIDMKARVSGIIRTSDNNLYVSCTSTPAQIVKIKATDYSVMQTNQIAEAEVGAGYGKMPGISAKGDTIYFSNATTKIYRHIFSTKQTAFMTDVADHITDAGVVYNNLSVDPISGEVYFNTIKGYGGDFLINDISVFNFSGSAPVLKADYKNYTHFPAGIYFTANF